MKMFKLVEKFCETCNKKLQLQVSRDIIRKRFCNRTCLGIFVGKNRDMAPLHAKSNSPEANSKKGHKKEYHHFWKKDRSTLAPRSGFELSNWRNSVFDKYDHICQMCFEKGGVLNAHHKAPYSMFKKLRFELSNGICLCHTCHKELHKAATELFGGLTSKENKIRIKIHALC